MTSIANEELMKKLNNQDKFDKLDYEFYFYCSLDFGKVKLSPNHIAFLTEPPHRELFLLEDKEKCEKIFADFLIFVKSAAKFKKTPKGAKTGVSVKVSWANKFKYLFKKKPSTQQTFDYFYKVLTDIKFIDKYNRIRNFQFIAPDQIKKIVENVAGEDVNNIGGQVFNIVMKIQNLPKGTKTTIAQLIDYDPKTNFVEPMTQGKVSYYVNEVCKKIEIYLEPNKDKIGGLAYFNEFTKF